MPLRIRCYINIERMNSERMQNNSVCQNGNNKKKGKTTKKWSHEIEDLKVMRIKNGHRAAINRKEWTRILLEAKVQKGR
jgi:hypothetical protein